MEATHTPERLNKIKTELTSDQHSDGHSMQITSDQVRGMNSTDFIPGADYIILNRIALKPAASTSPLAHDGEPTNPTFQSIESADKTPSREEIYSPGQLGTNPSSSLINSLAQIKPDVKEEYDHWEQNLNTVLDIKIEPSLDSSEIENVSESADMSHNLKEEVCKRSAIFFPAANEEEFYCESLTRIKAEIAGEDEESADTLHSNFNMKKEVTFQSTSYDNVPESGEGKRTLLDEARNPSDYFRVVPTEKKGRDSNQKRSQLMLMVANTPKLSKSTDSTNFLQASFRKESLPLSNAIEKINKLFPCRHCSASFADKNELEKHMMLHTGKKSLSCRHCSASFSNSNNLIQHIRTHTDEKPFNCNHCNSSFTRKSDLKKHICTLTGEKPFSCRHCKASFTVKKSLNIHMRTHSGEKPFSCSHCDASFTLKHHLICHMRTHTGEKPFSCSHCNASFAQISHVNGHMLTHTGEKPFSCSQCNASFITKSSLNTHMRTHTGEKPFNCSYCNSSFTQKGDLRKHLRTHTGEKPFSCPHCSASFADSSNLNKHMRTHTGEDPFNCSLCNASFTRKGGLKRHMRTHTGEKPFICSHCNSSFTTKSSLNSHMRTHTGEKPFNCSHCKASFTRKVNLIKHTAHAHW